jgi:Glycosyl transferase family 2
MSKKLSVLIDTYDHEKYIDVAIRSVLAQEGVGSAAIDIVVVDDGSTDRTEEIVRRFGSVVRYYRKANGGQASAFNSGIRLCEGDIICFLDGDDWWHRNKLKVVLNTFLENPAICGIGHGFWEVDEVSGSRIPNGPPGPIAIDFTSHSSISLFHKHGSCLGTSRLAMKRSAALALLDIPEPLVFEADEYMFTLLPTLGEVVILPEVLTYYRIHGANLFQDSRAVYLKYKNDARLLKRAAIYDCLSKQLPVELQRRGCNSSMIDPLLRPVHVQASRLKLMTSGGTPLENFRSEWRAAELLERASASSKIVLWISLALALVCPPRSYFKIRQAYSNLLRWRHHKFGAIQK